MLENVAEALFREDLVVARRPGREQGAGGTLTVTTVNGMEISGSTSAVQFIGKHDPSRSFAVGEMRFSLREQIVHGA